MPPEGGKEASETATELLTNPTQRRRNTKGLSTVSALETETEGNKQKEGGECTASPVLSVEDPMTVQPGRLLAG